MSRNFSAYDITGFLDASIGGYLSEIEACVVEMAEEEDKEVRTALKEEVQYIIRMCNAVLR